MTAESKHDVTTLTAEVVAAYAAANTISDQALLDLIRAVHAAFLSLASGTVLPAPEDGPVPAVPIKQSVFPSYIICLEDGARLKTLKRHLQTYYGMTPAQYRQRWSLPEHYPMVAPKYAAQRSEFAKRHALGRRPKTPEALRAKAVMPAAASGLAVVSGSSPTVECIETAARGKKRRLP